MLARRPVDDSKAAVRRRKSAPGDCGCVVLRVGDNARGVHLRVDRYLMCCFFFAVLQGFCFFSGVAGSFFCLLFFCLLFFMFYFPLFSNCSFGGFVAALIGPGEFRRCIDFFSLLPSGAAPGGIDSNSPEKLVAPPDWAVMAAAAAGLSASAERHMPTQDQREAVRIYFGWLPPFRRCVNPGPEEEGRGLRDRLL